MKFTAITLMLMLTPMAAQTLGEKTGVNAMLDRAPTGSDVLLELHQFDLFEQGADETAQTRGDDALKQYSTSQSNAAGKRDDELAKLSKKAGLNLKFSEQPSQTRSDLLAGLEGSVGPAFVRKYYESQVTEFDAAVSLLQRYLQKPDTDEIKSFATKQLPVLETGQKTAREDWKRAKE